MNIDELRKEINETDKKLLELFERRMDIVREIARQKKQSGIPVRDERRESEVLQYAGAAVRGELSTYAKKLYGVLLEVSRDYQREELERAAKPKEKIKLALIGKNISYSYSKEIHETLAECDYDIVSLEEQEVESFLKSMKKRGCAGCNVTIPYKKTAYLLCDEVSATAKKTAGVNTVTVRPDGTLYGDNTDYYGFMYMARRAGVDFNGKKVLVLGTGGTSATICTAVEDNGGHCFVVSRMGEDNYTNLERHSDTAVIVNATPVGTFPDTETRIIDVSRFPKCEAVLDVVYNPLSTRIVSQARSLGLKASGGLPMLVAQAVRASELFTGEKKEHLLEETLRDILRKKSNIVLIGMPGCGKSAVAKELRETLGTDMIDTDSEIEKQEGVTVQEIFATMGEEYFRELERAAVKDAAKRTGIIISTGGGAVLGEENRYNLRQNGIIVFIDRNPDALEISGRPLCEGYGSVKKLYEERYPIYNEFCDIKVSNDGALSDTVRKITEGI